MRVVGDHRRDGEPETQPEAEQERDRELLACSACGEVQTEDAGERADEEQQPGAAAEIAPDVGAERGTADG